MLGIRLSLFLLASQLTSLHGQPETTTTISLVILTETEQPDVPGLFGPILRRLETARRGDKLTFIDRYVAVDRDDVNATQGKRKRDSLISQFKKFM